MTPKATRERLKALRFNLERDIARCPLEHCTDDDIAYCGQCGWAVTALQLLADSETLAQIRALHAEFEADDYRGYDDFGMDIEDVLKESTTNPGHMTTNQKGEK